MLWSSHLPIQTNDSGAGVFTLFDADGDVLDFVESGLFATPSTTWITYMMRIVVPEEAAFWELDAQAYLSDGELINVFFDVLEVSCFR